MKNLKFWLSGMTFLLAACTMSAQNFQYVKVVIPEYGYTSITVSTPTQPKGLIVDTMDDYLMFCLDKDNDIITVSRLYSDDGSITNAVPVAVMKRSDKEFSYTKEPENGAGYYISGANFNALIGKDYKAPSIFDAVRNIKIIVHPPEGNKGRKIEISSVDKTFITYWW